MSSSRGDGASITPSEVLAAGGQAWSVRALLRWIHSHLEERGVESARLCSEILIGHVLGCDRLRLYMEPDRVPSDAERTRLRELVLRAGRHEPVQYLVGEWPFLGRTFEVGPSTLIPRPATETLVERAVEWYRTQVVDGQAPALRMADIGTGTGVIAVSVILGIRAGLRAGGCRPLGGRGVSADAAPLPTIQIDAADSTEARAAPGAVTDGPSLRCLATDIVPEAVDLAKRNVTRHDVTSAIDVRVGALFDPFRSSKPNSFDLICSNPPYVSDSEWEAVLPNVKDYEPPSALRAGTHGLDVIVPLVAQAPAWLRSGGLLLVEIAETQRAAVLALASDRATWASAEVVKDFEALDRVLVAVRR
ncbi:MAG: peptide chain release factor N(5)-glutamine methyltransferase [Phycisphaerae bacterium]|nr:peptide chain release factor N(5)-glutamine methyltransferase [Phycisphaerae bacterium]